MNIYRPTSGEFVNYWTETTSEAGGRLIHTTDVGTSLASIMKNNVLIVGEPSKGEKPVPVKESYPKDK